MNIFSNLVGQQITSGTRTGTGNNKLKGHAMFLLIPPQKLRMMFKTCKGFTLN